jgi:crotonobetainyl-CoA:carnitine CoA-transferase CaiB-like acyl-CoA transferase
MKRLFEAGALSRFRVIDLSQVRAGPTCVKQFADFGADVIKVEPPPHAQRQELYTGERDGADMLNLHRNKRSITVDLKSEGGRNLILELVKTADIVVENFRPDVKERLGLGYEVLSAVNPRIVLVSISGFGQDGPYRSRPGFDQILQGMSGLMSVTGAPQGDPMRAGTAVADIASGLYAALGGMTALLEREVSGRGQWVQVSLLHAAIALMDFQAARCSVEGETPGRMGNDHPTSMPTSAYPTSDGHINVGAGSDKQWVSLCEALGRPELALSAEFNTAARRSQTRVKLNELLSTEFKKRSREEWLGILQNADVPAGPIYNMSEVMIDPQVQHAKIFNAVTHPRRGDIKLIGQPAILTRTPAQLKAPLEDRGGSTEDVLLDLNYEEAGVEKLRAEGAI